MAVMEWAAKVQVAAVGEFRVMLAPFTVWVPLVVARLAPLISISAFALVGRMAFRWIG